MKFWLGVLTGGAAVYWALSKLPARPALGGPPRGGARSAGQVREAERQRMYAGCRQGCRGAQDEDICFESCVRRYSKLYKL